MSKDNGNNEEIQVQSKVKRIIAPCDKLSQVVFDLTAEEFTDLVDKNTNFEIVEGKKKGKEVITPFCLALLKDYKDKLPPDAFTREVFIYAASAFEQGFNAVSISMTFDAMTGGEEKFRVYKEQHDAIVEAFKKLDAIRISVDLEATFKAFPKYGKNYTGKFRISGSLLPCKFIETKINGQTTTVIKILDESPLMTVAKAKKQLVTYDITPLAIAGQHNTKQVVTIKNYLLRRIKLIKADKRKVGLNNSILFETIYRQCGLADADDGKKRDARKEIFETLDAFKAEGVFQDFEIERENGAYRAIKILF